jgi:PIN domain nuclease of toxin-antitoxin system
VGAVRILLDTHALLWWWLDDPSLGEAARDAIKDPGTEVLVSAASAWEVATKERLGRLPEAAEAARDFSRLVYRSRMTPLPITQEHAVAAGRLEGSHRDPIDRMLIAQAILESVPIVTRDAVFGDYPVELIW